MRKPKQTTAKIYKVYLGEGKYGPAAETPREAVELVTSRGKQHGDWNRQSFTARQFKSVVYDSWNRQSGQLTPSQYEAIEMICVKLSRILNGDPSHEDHWRDIQGYAELGLQK